MIDEATRIRVIRSIIGWSQKQMYERIGVTPNTIANWEKGRSIPQRKHREVLAEICMEQNIRINPNGYPEPVEVVR